MAGRKQETKQQEEVQQVQETHVEETPQVEESTQQETSFKDLCKNLSDLLNVLKNDVRELQQKMVELKVQHKAELDGLKKKKRRNTSSESASKAGFKPVMVSAELGKFLSLDTTQAHPRQLITKGVYKYIKDNNLYFEGRNKNVMKPDNKLTKLLGPFNLHIRPKDTTTEKGLSIFNIQKYLKKHMLSEETQA